MYGGRIVTQTSDPHLEAQLQEDWNCTCKTNKAQNDKVNIRCYIISNSDDGQSNPNIAPSSFSALGRL